MSIYLQEVARNSRNPFSPPKPSRAQLDTGPGLGTGTGKPRSSESVLCCTFRPHSRNERKCPTREDRPTTLQGGPSGCKLPFVAVPSQYGLLILKRSFQFHVNNRMCTTRWTTVYTDTKLSCPVLSASSVLCECIGHKNAHKWIGFPKHS